MVSWMDGRVQPCQCVVPASPHPNLLNALLSQATAAIGTWRNAEDSADRFIVSRLRAELTARDAARDNAVQ